MFREALRIRIDAIKSLYWQIRQEKEFRKEERNRVRQMREIEKSMRKVAKEDEKEFRRAERYRVKQMREIERDMLKEEIMQRVRRRY